MRLARTTLHKLRELTFLAIPLRAHQVLRLQKDRSRAVLLAEQAGCAVAVHRDPVRFQSRLYSLAVLPSAMFVSFSRPALRW
jgi:hypothetical protein